MYEPARSLKLATGKKKTSVPIFVGSAVSAVSRSGRFALQNSAVSVSHWSATTSQSSFSMASRTLFWFGDPTAGFSPMTVKPLILPFHIESKISRTL